MTVIGHHRLKRDEPDCFLKKINFKLISEMLQEFKKVQLH